MNLDKFASNLSKQMKWYDFSLLKGTVFFFTLFLITVWAGFRNLVLSFDWYWYLIISILLSISIFKKMFNY